MSESKYIIFATSNKDKVREITEMTTGKEVKVLTLKDIGFTHTYMLWNGEFTKVPL